MSHFAGILILLTCFICSGSCHGRPEGSDFSIRVADSEEGPYQGTTESPTTPCQPGLYPNTEDCTNYFECDGIQLQPKTCQPSTLLFDAVYKVCVFACEATCHPTARRPPNCLENVPNPLIRHHECDCTKFWYCMYGIGTEIQCPDNAIFDWKNMLCIPSADEDSETCFPGAVSPPKPTTTTPIPCVEGERRPNADDCTSYEECTMGQFKAMTCANSYLFSVNSIECETACDSTCENGSNNPFRCSVTDPGPYILPHICNCSQYIVCVSGEEYAFDCPETNYFDSASSVCTDADEVQCFPGAEAI